jgi:hypothetical protein
VEDRDWIEDGSGLRGYGGALGILVNSRDRDYFGC